MGDKQARSMDPGDYQELRQLLDGYLRMYATRDDLLTTYFSEDFSGFTGGGDFLVKKREEWVAITRQDFAQVKEAIRLELKDVSIQSLADTIAVATSFFTIHLPIKDHILSRETARLVLIYRKESAGWKICHSGISIPYHLVREGEVYPLKELAERNQNLEALIEERSHQLSEANENLLKKNAELAIEIAERKQADAALQRREELHRFLFKASPDNITIADAQGCIVMVSPVAFTMFACKREDEFMGHPLTDFIIPEERDRALSKITLKRQGITTGPSEYRGLRRNGTTFDIEVNSEFIRDAEGSPTGMVVIVRDITERKRADEEKKKLEAQNRQLQKSESLGRMAGAIAHHFNNQLQTVMMSLDLAMQELSKTAGGPLDLLNEALAASRKAAEVSSLMLTYLGQSTAKFQSLDFSGTCRQSLPMLMAAIPKNVIIKTNFLAAGPAILGNGNQIQQVLTNLITNAWEACGDGKGTIRLAIKMVPAADIPAANRFPVGSKIQEKVHACLEVADTGCGIAAKDVEKLFDPFFTSKFTGRGLGLAVVLGIVRAHYGVVTVASEPGQGSVFRVFLPVSAGAVAGIP
jgi:two-component system, cell cycle sensor histidine kinase and response regulator CckA